MTLSDIVNRDIQTIEADLGNQMLIWDGQSYPCVPSSMIDGEDTLGMGGFSGNKQQYFTVRTELFSGVFPNKNDIITFNGTDFEIDNISPDATGALLQIRGIKPQP